MRLDIPDALAIFSSLVSLNPCSAKWLSAVTTTSSGVAACALSGVVKSWSSAWGSAEPRSETAMISSVLSGDVVESGPRSGRNAERDVAGFTPLAIKVISLNETQPTLSNGARNPVETLAYVDVIPRSPGNPRYRGTGKR